MTLKLAYNISFLDLYENTQKVDSAFLSYLKEEGSDLHEDFVSARDTQSDDSELLIKIAPYLEDFIAGLFGIKKEVRELAAKHNELAEIYICRRNFIQRRVVKLCKGINSAELDIISLASELENLFGEPLTDRSFAKHVLRWEEDGEEEKILIAAKYALLATETGNSVLFRKPAKLDFNNLIKVKKATDDLTTISVEDLKHRNGFALTEEVCTLDTALGEANYCIYCHNRGKDSCSKGIGKPFKVTPMNVMQSGCPLEERISEMNFLKAQGCSIGALGVVTIDNPLCAATGNRICNDCLKSCIYQKQDPVDIPKVETRVLQDILDLPYGFEIYSLFSRWNPLNIKRPFPKKNTGYKVLVAGLGPAGYSLAHYLLNDGHTVVAVDGLKIEPLPEDLSGKTISGESVDFTPIKNIEDIFEDLDDRILAGFGGVAEYGITVRWNKNYLKVIRLLLERRKNFAMYGGIRFGSTITYDKAFELGFDHIALAMGAGKPTIVSMPNALARGVRTASDFLMSLQLTGAAKKDSITNLQLRLPVVVIGGGLTAIDAATEALAYYPLQVEKFLTRYETLVDEIGEGAVRERWTKEEIEIAEEFIEHGKLLRKEEKPISLLKKWGGAKLAYRKRFIDSPGYRLNHEEVEKALAEGIEFIENVSPAGIRVDDYDHVRGLRVNYTHTEENGREEIREMTIPARTVFMAAGTTPNTVLAGEDPKHFSLNGKFFTAIDENGNNVTPEIGNAKPEESHILVSKNDNGRFTSFFGDLHPSYAGNVVKAMASAKQGYPIVSKVLSQTVPSTDTSSGKFFSKLNGLLKPVVHDVIRLTHNIIEVVIKAPLAADEFKPGQFYRLQNYETFAMKTEDTSLLMEGLALTGAWVDKEKGLLSLIVLEMGGSSDLCSYLKKGEPVILMGPTGTPTEIISNETVMLIGGGLGNAVLFSIGKAFKDAGSKVLYFAGYKEKQDRYKMKEIAKAADTTVWCCDEGEMTVDRKDDKTFHGNIVHGIKAYAEGELGDTPIKLEDVDRIIVIGSDRMMAAVGKARHTVLKKYLKKNHIAIGSINSPMQCMMKEICAQCLQRHIDPETGERTYVYSCKNQDQDLDKVDFPHLNERLKQNTVQEKVTSLWIDRALD